MGLLVAPANGQCALFRDGSWTTAPCPGGGNCGLDDADSYPWVVIETHNGRSYGADFRTEAAAAAYRLFWSDFNNRRWPAFSGQDEGRYAYVGPLRKCEDMVGRTATDELHRRTPTTWLEWANNAAAWIRPHLEVAGLRGAAAAASYIERLHEAEERICGYFNVLNKFTDTATESIADAFDEIGAGLKEDAAAIYVAASSIAPDETFPSLPGQVLGMEYTEALPFGGHLDHRLRVLAEAGCLTIIHCWRDASSLNPNVVTSGLPSWESEIATGMISGVSSSLSTGVAQQRVGVHVTFRGAPKGLAGRMGRPPAAWSFAFLEIPCESKDAAEHLAAALRGAAGL